jgi:hypothetical protein
MTDRIIRYLSSYKTGIKCSLILIVLCPCHAEYIEKFRKLLGSLYCDAHGDPVDLAHKLPSEASFTDAFSNYLAVTEGATCLHALGVVGAASDPLSDCPICCATPGAPGPWP